MNMTSDGVIEIQKREENHNGLHHSIRATDGDGDDAARARNSSRRRFNLSVGRERRTRISLRMSWVVVTDGNGKRTLQIQWTPSEEVL
jgi:hypothetical protein